MALVGRVRTIVASPSLRRTYAFPLALYPGCVATCVAAILYGAVDVRDAFSGDLLLAPWVVAVFLTAFIPIALGLRFGWIGAVGYAFAFLVAVASFAVVPRVVDRVIRDDESSTAALLHIYDPLLDMLLVAAAVGVATFVGRLTSRRRSPT